MTSEVRPASVELDLHGNLDERYRRTPLPCEEQGYVGRRLNPVLDELNVLARRESHVFNKLAKNLREAIWARGLRELDAGAVVVLVFIIGRTHRYGKYAEWVPTSAFLEGVRGQSGEDHTLGLDMSENTLRKHLRALMDAHWIERWDLQRGGRLTYAFVPKSPGMMLFDQITQRCGTLPVNWDLPVPMSDELLVYTGPDHAENQYVGIDRGTVFRFKSSDGALHAVMAVDRDGNDIARRAGLFMILRRQLRRMRPDESHQAFGGRLYGEFEIIDNLAEFMRDAGIRSDVERHRLLSPDVED